MSRLRLTEIFHSLQGESSTVGLPTVFVRLTGCPLRCTYCDSEYAFHGGEYFELDDIVQQVVSFGAKYVTVTGGEPLAQKNCPELLTKLSDEGLNVSIETSGALSIGTLDPRVCVVMDLKGPSSGEMSRNLYSNIDYLRTTDQVKFIISNRADYDWARMTLDQYELQSKAHILFSPCFGEIEASEIAQWILDDKLNVRFQIQLHKLLWGDKPGH